MTITPSVAVSRMARSSRASSRLRRSSASTALTLRSELPVDRAPERNQRGRQAAPLDRLEPRLDRNGVAVARPRREGPAGRVCQVSAGRPRSSLQHPPSAWNASIHS